MTCSSKASQLIAAGDHPQRLRSEAAWAHLCGTAPIPASSGKVRRYRLSPGGDRQANALWQIVITRTSSHPATRAYVARGSTEGLSKPEIIRCLKRYVAREVYHRLRAVWPVRVVEVLALVKDGHQVPLVPDQGPVEQLTAATADPRSIIEFIRGGWTAQRIISAPAAWMTASNAAVKLASRSCSDEQYELIVKLLDQVLAAHGRVVCGQGSQPGFGAWYEVDGQQLGLWNLRAPGETVNSQGRIEFRFSDLVKTRGFDCADSAAAELEQIPGAHDRIEALREAGLKGWPSIYLSELVSDGTGLPHLLAAIDLLAGKKPG